MVIRNKQIKKEDARSATINDAACPSTYEISRLTKNTKWGSVAGDGWELVWRSGLRLKYLIEHLHEIF